MGGYGENGDLTSTELVLGALMKVLVETCQYRAGKGGRCPPGEPCGCEILAMRQLMDLDKAGLRIVLKDAQPDPEPEEFSFAVCFGDGTTKGYRTREEAFAAMAEARLVGRLNGGL